MIIENYKECYEEGSVVKKEKINFRKYRKILINYMILGDIIEFLILSEELKSNWDRFYVIKKMRQQKYLVLKDKNYDACD